MAEGRGTVEGEFLFAYSLREVLYRRKKVTAQGPARVQEDLLGQVGDDLMRRGGG